MSDSRHCSPEFTFGCGECTELAPYIERRPYDPEGLFYYGVALKETGRTAEARQMYERAIEAASIAAAYASLLLKWRLTPTDTACP